MRVEIGKIYSGQTTALTVADPNQNLLLRSKFMAESHSTQKFHPLSTHPNFIDLTGQRFGLLTVLGYAGRDGFARWFCLCDCGNEINVAGYHLRRGSTKSCGCRRYTGDKQRTHGQTKTRLYKVWTSIKTRCYNPKCAYYASYGGRGIEVCQRWHSFADFAADIGTGPTPKHSIDRKDNDGGYWCGKCAECISKNRPSNCRWATPVEQTVNRRVAVLIEFQGKTQCAKAWAVELHIAPATIRTYMRRGMSGTDALTFLVERRNARRGEK